MSQPNYQPELIKGIEILSFEHVELQKVKKDGTILFNTSGVLNAVYFDYFGKFMLQLNNWRYTLVDKLPVASVEPLVYTLPGYDGTYIMKIKQMSHPAVLSNFEEILRNTTSFSQPYGATIVIPEDAITKHPDIKANNESGQPLRKRDIIKQEVQKMADKVYYKYWDSRNTNMLEPRTFEAIRSTTEGMAPSHNFKREEIEVTIVSANEIKGKLESPTENFKEKALGMMEQIKESAYDLKAKLTGEPNQHHAETSAPEAYKSGEKPKVFDMTYYENELRPHIDHHANPAERGSHYRTDYSHIAGGQSIRVAQHEAKNYGGAVKTTSPYYDVQPRTTEAYYQNPHSDITGKIVNYVGEFGTHGSGEVVGAPPMDTNYHPSLMDRMKTKLPFLGGSNQKEEGGPTALLKREFLKAAIPVLIGQITGSGKKDEGRTIAEDDEKYRTIGDKIKANIPFMHEVPVSHGVDVNAHPSSAGFIEKIKAKLPFGHNNENGDHSDHPGVMDKLKSGLICGGNRIPSEDMFTYDTHGQATLVEKIKRAIPMGGQHQERHLDITQAGEQTQPGFVERVKAKIPEIVGKIESKIPKRTEVTSHTEKVELIELPPDTIYQGIHSLAPVQPLQSAVHHHKHAIFEQAVNPEPEIDAAEVREVLNRETHKVMDMYDAMENAPQIIEVQREARAIEPTKMFKSEVHDQGALTPNIDQSQSITSAEKVWNEGIQNQSINKSLQLAMGLTSAEQLYNQGTENQVMNQSQGLQFVQAQTSEQRIYDPQTPQFEAQTSGHVYDFQPAPTVRPDGSYQDLPRINTNPAINYAETQRTEFNVNSQPIVEYKAVETVQTYPPEQMTYSLNVPSTSGQDALRTDIYAERVGYNGGITHSETFGRANSQSSRMVRSQRPGQELQEIQSRIHRSDVITHSPRVDKQVGTFENVDHYQA